MNRYFIEELTQTAKKHVKEGATSSPIRRIQIKSQWDTTAHSPDGQQLRSRVHIAIGVPTPQWRKGNGKEFH